jgi:glucose-1-phosphate thymidylyltransferase
MTKAVILAAGRGTRMQRPANSAELSPEQEAAARRGFKALVPVGRPFIDYVLGGLRDAGYKAVCLVVGPAHQALRDHCLSLHRETLEIHFAVQEEPLGTADAVRAAAGFVGTDDFTLLNADNYYPIVGLRGLLDVGGPAVAGFVPHALCRGNIAPERLRDFAVIQQDERGLLRNVVEKPSDELQPPARSDLLISMNCWRFTPDIFQACRSIPRSRRNEFELTDAVNFAVTRMGTEFAVLRVDEPVLDLSTQADVAEVTRRLAMVRVRL